MPQPRGRTLAYASGPVKKAEYAFPVSRAARETGLTCLGPVLAHRKTPRRGCLLQTNERIFVLTGASGSNMLIFPNRRGGSTSMMISYRELRATRALPYHLACLDSFDAFTKAVYAGAVLCPEVARSGPLLWEGGRG